MIGRDSDINVSLTSVWDAWYKFQIGKRKIYEFDNFTFHLESNLYNLHQDLLSHTYQHGNYRTFYLTDTKKRTISVATIRDRVVHRLLYDYLVSVFDKGFIYDAWSCRKGKGLMGAINRAQYFLKKYPHSYIWRADITKFFESVDQKELSKFVKRKVSGDQALWLINNVISSFYSFSPGKGMPIGNLTSQIFCNIYLNELDRYVSHKIKPLAYMRYGDDFIVIVKDRNTANSVKNEITGYIENILKLIVHKTNNIVIPARQGIHFLGCDIFPTGKRLRKKIYPRIRRRLNIANYSSYRSLILAYGNKNEIKWFDWSVIDIIKSIQ